MASAAATPPRPQRSFAGLLEEFAAPQAKFPPQRGQWSGDSDGLEDDVATLTYEHALNAQARYRREPVPLASDPSADSTQNPLNLNEEPPRAAAVSSTPPAVAETSRKSRKSSSVTVRLSAAEDRQLRVRAAEANLTVSAYLRSCAFEVESLRAQVKQAVAQMRETEPQSSEKRRRWLPSFIHRLLHCG